MLSRIPECLDQNGVKCSPHAHPQAYTAREVPSSEHLPEHEMAKTAVFAEDVYSVRFAVFESWGEQASACDAVCIDLG